MATLTTKETGGLAPPVTNASFSPPEAAIAPERLGAFLDGTGLNGPFLADLLSSFLMHEQCGLHLYRTAISLTVDPTLREKYEEFGAETRRRSCSPTAPTTPPWSWPSSRRSSWPRRSAMPTWTMIQTLMGEMPEGEARAACQAAVDQVEEQEDEHIRWARQTWEQLILTQAQSSALPR